MLVVFLAIQMSEEVSLLNWSWAPKKTAAELCSVLVVRDGEQSVSPALLIVQDERVG